MFKLTTLKHRLLYYLYIALMSWEDILGIELDWAYDYYYKNDFKGMPDNAPVFCRKNKFNGSTQFRTMRPLINGYDPNQWLYYNKDTEFYV